MSLIYACIAPHINLAPEQLPHPNYATLTRHTIAAMGKELEALRPDTVIVLTPHGVRIEGATCVSLTERAYADLTAALRIEFDVDQVLAEAIAITATAHHIPVAKCIYGASAGPHCALPLDWGASTPLYFMGAHYTPPPKIVVVCPSRTLSLADQVAFGRALAATAVAAPQRIALIASADQGHAHHAAGPYGFHPAAAQYDAAMQAAIRDHRLETLLDLPAELVNDAKVDSLWQTLILHGALQIHPLRGELLSYEVCEYVGVLCAAYRV